MNRILITGGCGFIGSNFIRYLLHADPDVEVLNLDALTYAGTADNLADLEADRYHFVRGDVADRDTVRNVVGTGVDTILNFAAESHVDRSIRDSSPFVHTNTLGTQVLLDAARDFGVKRFVQISTDEVYGSLGHEGYFTEDSPLAPNSPYSASKAAADLLVRSYAHTFGIDTVITRCSNNYGPFQFPEKLIPLAIAKLMRNESVPVYGDGLNVRDWIHVEDHCRGIEMAWRKGRSGQVYNFGGRAERTNLEIVHALLGFFGKPASLIQFVRDRPGHDRRYAVDCSKAEKELGWRRNWTFEGGLRNTVEWYLTHQSWLNAR